MNLNAIHCNFESVLYTFILPVWSKLVLAFFPLQHYYLVFCFVLDFFQSHLVGFCRVL